MNRRTAIRRLGTLFLTTASLAQAQQPKKVPLIGYLSSGNPATASGGAQGMKMALGALGYVEGQNIAIEYRYAGGKQDRYAELAAELVRLRVDIIVASGGAATIQAAKNATKTIPIVMMGSGLDPVEAGLVESLARPGGNVTGITNLITKLGGKRLELFKEAVPKLARVAVLYEPATSSSVLEVEEIQTVAPALKLTIRPWEVRVADDFEKVFGALNKQRSDGLFVIRSPLTSTNRTMIVDLALKNRLPSMYDAREPVEAGGLMSYGADQADRYRQVAWYIDKILKGTKPADLPVQQPMKFELVVNLKTAKQIGVNIDPNLLARAQRVIR